MVVPMNFGDPRLPDRFWNKVIPEPNSGCWLWLAASKKGYGAILVGSSKDGTRRMAAAHVVSYLALVGPYTAEDLDHKCRVRCCVNPAHLEPLSHRDNVLRGVGATARNAAKKTCSKGHVFDGMRRGARECSICVLAARERYRRRMGKPIRGPRGPYKKRAP